MHVLGYMYVFSVIRGRLSRHVEWCMDLAHASSRSGTGRRGWRGAGELVLTCCDLVVRPSGKNVQFVSWMNVPEQFYVLPHRERNCISDMLSDPVTFY